MDTKPNCKETIIKEIYDAVDLFERKNQSYSDAWTKVGKILDIIFEGETIALTGEQDYIVMEIMTRKIEKLVRFLWQTIGSGKDLVGETALDTLKDDGIYSFMLLGYLKTLK